MTQVIEVVLSPVGEAKVPTRGIAGATCRQASRFIEEALGVRAGEQLTSEFHQAASQTQTAQTIRLSLYPFPHLRDGL